MSTSGITRAFAACISLTLLLAMPGAASACSIPFRTIGALYLSKSDLKRPIKKTTGAAFWKLDPALWLPLEPQLNQYVVIKNHRIYEGVTYGDQKAISIDAKGTYGTDNVYMQDPESLDTCNIVGQREWTAPFIRKMESTREVRILVVTTPNTADDAGCMLDPEPTVCPQLTRAVIVLKKPMGKRKLVFADFESPLDDANDESEDASGFPNYG